MIPILTIIICLGSIIGIVIYISKTEIKPLDKIIMKTNWDKDRYEFKFKEGNWRWTRIASNNRIVGASSEGYRSKYKMLDNAKRLGFNKEIHKYEFV